MSPEISIIVPVYNVERYLSDCLSSILNQDFNDWECILVDDGSKDGSGIICDEYCKKDRRFRVIHKENGGVSSARNVGIEQASGEWISFVDSDDSLVSDALFHMLFVNKNVNADVCLCPIVRGERKESYTNILTEGEKERLIWACLTYRTSEYAAKGFMVDAPHAKLFRASIIRQHTLRFKEDLCKSEDALFDAEFYQFAGRIVMDSHPVYRYTINPNSICHTFKFDNIQMFDRLLGYERDFLYANTYTSPMFRRVLEIRAFVALEQVLYEAGADKLPMAQRVKALKLLADAETIFGILQHIDYASIAQYINGRSRRIDLYLLKNRRFRTLCYWVDWCNYRGRLRVYMVKELKKLLRIDPDVSLSSRFH